MSRHWNILLIHPFFKYPFSFIPLSLPLPSPILYRLEFISNQRAFGELRLLITHSFAFLHINDCRVFGGDFCRSSLKAPRPPSPPGRCVCVCVCLRMCVLHFLSFGQVICPCSRVCIDSHSMASHFVFAWMWHLLGDKRIESLLFIFTLCLDLYKNAFYLHKMYYRNVNWNEWMNEWMNK